MRRKRKDEILLGLILIFLILSLFWVLKLSKSEKTDYWAQQVEAAERMKACMRAIKGYKEALGIPLSEEDYFETGMIGEPFNLITTTLGEIKAKRTTANPDMAALIVKMMHEADLKKGDRVGLGFSGSFPSLNIAVLCAADVLELEVVPITSVGASTYGANHYDLTFPDMMHRLYLEGLIGSDSVMVSIGGDYDIGANIDSDKVREIETRLRQLNLNVYKEPDLVKNVMTRLQIYGDVACFIAVGGNVTNSGISEEAITMGQGILEWENYQGIVDSKSGVIQYYLSNQVPVINLLNIEKITSEYGMPFDPIKQSPIGEGSIYDEISYPRGIISFILALSVGLLVYFFKKRGL